MAGHVGAGDSEFDDAGEVLIHLLGIDEGAFDEVGRRLAPEF